MCGLLVVAVGLVFGGTLYNQFNWYDEDGFVHQNPHVTPGLTLAGLRWALTDGPYGDWYPLTSLSHMLDCQLYGLNPGPSSDQRPAALRLGRAAVFGPAADDPRFLAQAWVAAVFAIHPLHVESVAWLAERRDVLAGLFFMLTLGAYTLYVERPSPARYLAVAGWFALGLMSKPIVVTLPFVLLLLDCWPLRRFTLAAGTPAAAESGRWLGRLPVGWRLVVEKIPLLALSAASCAIVVLVHKPMKGLEDIEPLSLAARAANALVASPPTWASRSGPSICLPSIRIWGGTCPRARRSRPWSCCWRSAFWPPGPGGSNPICWWAGSGFWACWCRSADWWVRLFRPGATATRISVKSACRSRWPGVCWGFIDPGSRAGRHPAGVGPSRPSRRRRSSRWEWSPGSRRLTGAAARRFGPARHHVTSEMRWPTIAWAASTPARGGSTRRLARPARH